MSDCGVGSISSPASGCLELGVAPAATFGCVEMPAASSDQVDDGAAPAPGARAALRNLRGKLKQAAPAREPDARSESGVAATPTKGQKRQAAKSPGSTASKVQKVSVRASPAQTERTSDASSPGAMDLFLEPGKSCMACCRITAVDQS